MKIPAEYSDFVDVFLTDQVIKLSKNTGINKHTIKWIKEKQLAYRLIYALSLLELEILKIYIKTHLKTGFIWPFKSLANILILFNKKLNGSFFLCVN